MENKIRMFEGCAGYGGGSFGLKKAGIQFECVGYSEIDKYAIQCYEHNHREVVDDWVPYNGSKRFMGTMKIPKNYGNISLINPEDIPDFDLFLAGFPCQSFSIAGKREGFESKKTGNIFFDICKILNHKKPGYVVLENVAGILSHDNGKTHKTVLDTLKKIGYGVAWKCLNSKNYGIPQNRERVWYVCKLGGWDFMEFTFPEKEKLKLKLKDILEDEVDEKYYLKEETVKQLLPNQDVSYCIDANYFKGTNIKGFIEKKRWQIIQVNNPKHSNDRLYSEKGISPTLNAMQGGNRQPFIVASRGRNPKDPSDRTTGSPTEQRLEPQTDGTSNCLSTVQKDNYVCVKNATAKRYQEVKPGDGINLEQPNSETRRGRVQSQSVGTLQTNDQRDVLTEDMRIRKLTPTECFRLMGFLDDGINLEGLSNSQRYKLAGNGWDINLVSKIFKRLFSNKFQ